MKIQYHFLLLLIFLGACSGQVGKKETKSTEEISTVTQQKDSFPAGEVIPSVNIKDNGYGSFALYLPHQYNQNQHLPALIFLDPHGDGSFPLDRYKGLAEKFGVVLVGSNDSKNGVTFDQKIGRAHV